MAVNTIRWIREQKGIPLHQMSDLTKIDFDTLSRIENNQKVGSVQNYTSIAQSLDMSIGQLLATVDISPEAFQ